MTTTMWHLHQWDDNAPVNVNLMVPKQTLGILAEKMCQNPQPAMNFQSDFPPQGSTFTGAPPPVGCFRQRVDYHDPNLKK